jgi:hypothetical protein
MAFMETTVSDQSKVPPTLGYLLLRDGHAIPLHGISPEDIKAGAKERVTNAEFDSIRHRQCLTAIVDRLGFSGDFGTFQRQGWPHFQRFLNRHGCTHRVGLFPVHHGGCIDFYFGEHGGPRPRQLADRIFNDPDNVPKRVFLGYGVNWRAWDSGNGVTAPSDGIASIGIDADTATRYAQELFARRHDLAGQWGFLDDKLVDGPMQTVVDKSYWPRASPTADREKNFSRVTAAVKAFRAVFDCQRNGWVDIHPYNERLVVLRTHDGGWDVLWRNYRDEAPPGAADAGRAAELDLTDMPLSMMNEGERRRSLYLRQDLWEEQVEHEAEQAFYNRGGSIAERQITSSLDVLTVWLREQGKLTAPAFVARDSKLPPGFSTVELGGRKVAISEMISVGAFQSMLGETGYGERRGDCGEPWERANEGASDAMPVGASWVDAQAFCAWKERKTGVMMRLPTRDELRQLRAFFSPHYERLAHSDFPWEHYPPRPMSGTDGPEPTREVPSAVAWSEPRFLEPRQDLPALPPDGGWATTSRKRWHADFPPRATWNSQIPLVKHGGLDFIDAWDAYEWCQERGWISGRFWEGEIGATSWGAYKNVKTTFRLVMELEG